MQIGPDGKHLPEEVDAEEQLQSDDSVDRQPAVEGERKPPSDTESNDEDAPDQPPKHHLEDFSEDEEEL